MLSNTGINRVILLGAVNEPFSQFVDKEGNAFVCFNLVTTEHIKKGCLQTEHQECHKIKLPQKLITQDGLELVPGQSLFVEGKIQTTSFTDEQKIKRYNLEIVVTRVDVLTGIDIKVAR